MVIFSNQCKKDTWRFARLLHYFALNIVPVYGVCGVDVIRASIVKCNVSQHDGDTWCTFLIKSTSRFNAFDIVF